MEINLLKIKLEIRNYPELLALHRVILEAKFSLTIRDGDIAASTLIASLAERIIEKIINVEIEQGDAEAQAKWDNWRRINPSRYEWKVALQHIRESREYWDRLNSEERRSYVKLVLSPFQPTPGIMDEFVRQVEQES